MTTLTITLADEPMLRLKQLANESGVAPEELFVPASSNGL